MERWSDKVNSSLQAEAVFVLTNGSSETVISPVLGFTNNDFIPSWSIGAQEKITTITIPGNINKLGTIKLKIREKFNGNWSEYRFVNKQYSLIRKDILTLK